MNATQVEISHTPSNATKLFSSKGTISDISSREANRKANRKYSSLNRMVEKTQILILKGKVLTYIIYYICIKICMYIYPENQ